ncbi:tRNA threonylcarbamoyladenosine biosynthesis protein TsaB [hydrothermal vent metagenome]|uniref:tRNA threonylcarbamoyladenosine biosynthesis protein TsaB n=1 Tax=hydrothermal vent metagenome TaxID=652676 RepID=A0A3B0YG11_9ZZZZ
MLRLLAIETATEYCSVALYQDGDVIERYEHAPRRHAELVLPWVEAVLAEADVTLKQLDAITFGRGPGSFTGLRIAAGVTQGLAFGAGVPVVPISTLAALARGAHKASGKAKIFAALDARMKEVYWGAYRFEANGNAVLTGEECVCMPDAVPIPEGEGWFGAGSGWESYAEPLSKRCAIDMTACLPDWQPHAADVARLAVIQYQAGQAIPPEQAAPVYLRDNVADKPKPKV